MRGYCFYFRIVMEIDTQEMGGDRVGLGEVGDKPKL